MPTSPATIRTAFRCCRSISTWCARGPWRWGRRRRSSWKPPPRSWSTAIAGTARRSWRKRPTFSAPRRRRRVRPCSPCATRTISGASAPGPSARPGMAARRSSWSTWRAWTRRWHPITAATHAWAPTRSVWVSRGKACRRSSPTWRPAAWPWAKCAWRSTRARRSRPAWSSTPRARRAPTPRPCSAIRWGRC